MQTISSHRVFLDLENPRVDGGFENEPDAILWLCENENVLTLAKDIRDNGPNPLELIAVMKKGSNPFVALEGNRRVCAVMLLNDPERAPTGLKDKFHAAAKGWTPLKEWRCQEFPDRQTAQIWLDRIHGGKDGGRGRSDWDSEVKARRTKTTSSVANKLPLSLMDYASANGMLNEQDKKGKLAIVQRFSGNPVFRNQLGLSSTDDGFSRELPKPDFDALLAELFADIVGQNFKAHEFNKQKVESYVKNTLSKVDVSGTRQNPEPLFGEQQAAKQKSPTRPPSPTKIARSQDLGDALSSLGNYKLGRLYHSITTLSAKVHCPLLYVAAWSFIECLTSLDGRNAHTDFTSYLNQQRLKDMGLGDKNKTKSIRNALRRISEFGNGTKHDGEAAGFSSEQLINDFQVVEKLIKNLVSKIDKAGGK